MSIKVSPDEIINILGTMGIDWGYLTITEFHRGHFVIDSTNGYNDNRLTVYNFALLEVKENLTMTYCPCEEVHARIQELLLYAVKHEGVRI
jgi:hypothetical protein